VERAYARSDLLERRQSLMEKWCHVILSVVVRDRMAI
jgi:hypothetical protein